MYLPRYSTVKYLFKCFFVVQFTPTILSFVTDQNFFDCGVEPVKSSGLLYDAQLEVVERLHAEVSLGHGLVQGGGEILRAAKSRHGAIHLVP